MIIIQTPSSFTDEPALLRFFRVSHFVLDDTVTLVECIFTGDESISIGYYNDCIIVSEHGAKTD